MKPLFGYYFNGPGNRWPGLPGETDSWTDLDVYMWRQFDLAGIEEGLVGLRQAVKRSVRKNRNISLDLDLTYRTEDSSNPWRRQIKKASRRFITMPFSNPWKHVKLIDVADEPSFQQAAFYANVVRKHLGERELPAPPIGATFSYMYQTQEISPGLAQSLDWIGLEAYLDVSTQYDTRLIAERIYNQLQKQARKLLSDEHKVVIVLQAYSRNGNWHNIMSLRELQVRSYEAAVELFGLDRILAFKLFSWMRPSGTKSLPAGIRYEHQAIWRKLQQ